MRFPSLQSLAGGAWRTFLRFPIAILLAIKATGLGIWWEHLSRAPGEYGGPGWHTTIVEPPNWPRNAVVSCYLGMLLSVAVSKWIEKRRERGAAGGDSMDRESSTGDRGLAIGLQIAVLVLAGLYYWSLPPDVNTQMVIRTVVLALGLHWLIAVIGFGSGEVNGFWIFNKRLFLRVLTAWLYSTVLYIGVSLALLAIEKLFNADIRFEVYQDCWWVLGGLFSIWFFLAGFPGSYENPAVISDYPRGLKIFTQYVLLSLVTIYLLILYAYMFKIVFTAHWPVGWVAWMVMAFAVAGILSLLLIYPLRNEENNTWIRSYAKFFYVALLPLIVLLFCAIYKRVAPYGITEQRYFLLALAFWLLFITVYFLLSRMKDIRLVPLSLCILAFLSVWGPWGAFAVSVHSQKHRLAGLLEKYGLMANGKVVTGKTGVKVSFKDRKAISSVTEYLVDSRGYQVLQPLFAGNLDSIIKEENLTEGPRYEQTKRIVKLMNVEYATQWSEYTDSVRMAPVSVEFDCSPDPDDPVIPLAGIENMAQFEWFPRSQICRSFTVGKDRLRICPNDAWDTLRLDWRGGPVAGAVDLKPVIRDILQSGGNSVGLPADKMVLPIVGRSLSGKILLSNLRGDKTDSTVNFNRIKGIILFSRK
jgi:hypothetical protein